MTNCIKYWIKLIKISDVCYSKACYNMLKAYDDQCKVTWATHIRALLVKYGFRYVWMSQEIGDDVLFIEVFKRRLIDNEKLLYYKEYKINLEFEPYIKIVEISKHLKSLAKICCVSHKLEIEKGRNNHVTRSERVCMNCNLRVIEDEYHVILICHKYLDLRIIFILPEYYTQPSLERFCQFFYCWITKMQMWYVN